MTDSTWIEGFILPLSLFAVAVLGTLSLVLIWEAARRWLRAREARRVLRKMPTSEMGRPDGGPSTLLAREKGWGPAWLEDLLLLVPRRADLQRLLDQAGVRWGVASLLLSSVGMAVAVALPTGVFSRGLLLPFVAAGVGAYLPWAFLKVQRARRFQAFEEHFPEAIDLLARSARAGHSLAAGLQVVGEEAEEPVASEFRQVYEEQRFGLPLKESLLGLAERVDLVDTRIFVTAVIIQRESGGNLAENLDSLSQVIRGRFRFRRDVKTKTAHGRMTGLVVGLAPVAAGVGMYTLNPDYMRPLLVEPLGRLMLAVGGTMMLVGFLIIRRMVDVKF